MSTAAAYLALGSNDGAPPARLTAGLGRLVDAGLRLAAVSTAVWSPYETEPGRPDGAAPPVLNAVAEMLTDLDPTALLRLLLEVEAAEGRRRDAGPARRLDLDLLALGDARRREAPALPHPRALDRAFVLAPWEEIAPLYEVPGTGRTVTGHAATLRARRPAAFQALRPAGPPAAPGPTGACARLENAAALAAWRAEQDGRVGVVPTMGGLHAGHDALVRRARAECDAVLATLFVNPLQFAPGEDLDRYPRTLAGDLSRLAGLGCDAVYLPAPSDVYPPAFSTYVTPDGPARGLEGAVRPGHFRGVATVVLKIWQRTRPDRVYFGWKDAQQLAVVRRMARDLDLGGEIVACPTVRDEDGLALSSRNRYLDPAAREQARRLPRALDALVAAAAGGRARGVLLAEAREALAGGGLTPDYLEIVDPGTMEPVEISETPALVVAAVRVGGTRLLDNRWLARAAGTEAS